MIPFVTIELDRPRKLRFGMGAIVEYEQITGKKVQEIDEDISFSDLSNLLWVMLRQEQPDLTREQVLALVDDHAQSIGYVTNKVSEAITAAFNTGKKTKNV